MDTIQWNDEFSVGNEEIDAQHKKWFEIYNNAHDKMLGIIKSNKKTLGTDALKEVIEYTKYHFSFEENYMSKIQFPGLNEHRNLHNEFIQKIDKIVLDINLGRFILTSEIIKMIENWLVDHILNEDQKFKK